MSRAAGATLLVAVSTLVACTGLEAAVRALGLFEVERARLETDARVPPVDEEAERSLLLSQIHPYVGWIKRVGSTNAFRGGPLPIFEDGELSEWTRRQRNVNRFGHLSEIEDYRDVPEADFAVGVFGGSVASNLSTIGGERLRERLAERMGAPVESIRILNFGSGAYKQPQQLFGLIQAAMLDIPLDLVINLDGYNEVVLGAKDARSGHHPFFPVRRFWAGALELAHDPSPEQVLLTAEVIEARRRVEGYGAWLRAGGLLTHSALARSVVAVASDRARAQATRREQALQELIAERPANALLASLPDPCVGTPEECRASIASVWEQSSRLMAEVADQIGAGYVHVLQPNQYVADAKPLSAEEREHTVPNDSIRRRIELGYPLLQEHAQSLYEAGITFVDLTAIFEERPETLYRDSCCHMNAAGNALLADAVAAAIPDDALER